jgi:hypothetical protein
MKNPFSSVKSRYNDIPIHRRVKYNVLWVLAIVALITVTVVAIIDMNKTNEINTADPIGTYDTITYIPIVFEDDTDVIIDGTDGTVVTDTGTNIEG